MRHSYMLLRPGNKGGWKPWVNFDLCKRAGIDAVILEECNYCASLTQMDGKKRPLRFKPLSSRTAIGICSQNGTLSIKIDYLPADKEVRKDVR